jgi:perosamine synthetase
MLDHPKALDTNLYQLLMTKENPSTIASNVAQNSSHPCLRPVPLFPDTIGTFMARDALSLAASYLSLTPSDGVLLPIFNCQDVLKAFVSTNRVVFYDVRPDLTIDPQEVAAKLKGGGIRMMMITNYFGFLQPHRNEIKELCRANGVALIEDCAHSLLTPGSGDTGDLAIYSFRKILPIPDGGGLRINGAGKRPSAKFLPRLFSDVLSALNSVKSRLKIHSHRLSRAGFTSQARKFGSEKTIQTKTRRILPLSHFAEMAMMDLSLPEIIRRRREDFKFWQELCGTRESLMPVFLDLPHGVCPLGFPLRAKNREVIEARARKAGIALRVHWRLDPALGSECPVSHALALKMLTLPLFPELNDRDRRVLREIIVDA